MKAVNGNLDMSKKYKLVDVDYGGLSESSCESCQNCGNIISNVATVEREDGKKYRIGLDCMATITSMNPSDIQEAKNRIARIRNFIKALKTKATSITLHPKYKRVDFPDGKYDLVPDKTLGFRFRMYAYKTKIMTSWDVNAIGQGDYDTYKKIINTLSIPVTECDK